MPLMLMLLTMVSGVMMLRMASDCCSSVMMNVRDPGSEVHLLQGARLGFYSQIGFYGARPQYRCDPETNKMQYILGSDLPERELRAS